MTVIITSHGSFLLMLTSQNSMVSLLWKGKWSHRTATPFYTCRFSPQVISSCSYRCPEDRQRNCISSTQIVLLEFRPKMSPRASIVWKVMGCRAVVLVSRVIHWVHGWVCCWEWGLVRRDRSLGDVTWKGMFLSRIPGPPWRGKLSCTMPLQCCFCIGAKDCTKPTETEPE